LHIHVPPFFSLTAALSPQVVDIVSGELNAAAARKYDVEAWFPASATYRELVSASNCTDYQARRLGVRVRSPTGVAAPAPGADGAAAAAKKPAKEYAHMLNATLAATERTLCCVLENWQEAGGVRVPPALQPFMLGIDFIPFRKAFDAKGKLVDVPGAARGVAFPAGTDGAASMSAA
jgi:seryl-tRNA synthetase